MSSIQTLVVIALVLLVTSLVIFMLIMNKRQVNEIIAVDNTVNKIMAMRLEEDIARLKKMDLAGESLITLKTWQKSYQETAKKKLPDVKQLLRQAAEDNSRYRLFKARKNIKQAHEIIKPTFEDAKNTKAVFTDLLESNRENQQQYDALSGEYQQVRKSILATSFDFGSALDKLENELSSLEGDFVEAKNLSAQGDHVEAKRVLSKIKNDLTKLQEKLPKLKQAERQLEVIFQEQLSELSAAYKKMVAEKYYVAQINVLDEIKKIHDQIEGTKHFLTELDVEEIEQRNAKIKKEIANLYDVLAKEYQARPFVEENQSKILTLIAHEQVEAKNLLQKLRHIDESYELTHGELETSKKLVSEINDMNRQYTVDSQNIADGKAVYSEIKNSWLAMLERLHQIDDEQKKMADDVDGLYDAENVADDSIKRFKQEVALVYRRLERRNLPGKPDAFIQLYTLVVNEISHISEELNRVRINMEKISDELIQISDDVDRLKREADDIINSANLVELTVQYANKYPNNDTIKKAKKKTMQLYGQDYLYKEALDTIATAIEKVEPGAYQRLENLYYSEKNQK
ncbi:septation ring formation regulator EzrA [Lactobacillus sp. ESL0791]|uniref:septation ring formation regulator EzrA n=1 Tax=Lactobacillus sp. ESL0791 TaxID=2983234 RepID=UPI0023F7FE21|nr:septation ring formation regulator EzrA [Lactobacillus sp. ESL0791]MDF7638790.1 septation ring formation regulator EzrA [Lactobacillus sp. ESL0791]